MNFTERYADKILGSIGCFDRIIITGTIPNICYPEGMRVYFKTNNIKIFDYPQWVKPLTEEIVSNTKKIAQENGIEIEFVRKIDSFRKDDRIKEIIKKRGEHSGLVHIFSALETCYTYKPWHDKQTHQTFFKQDIGKCLHYYFYFIDERLGLCYLRVTTWAPFRLQFYCNGHNIAAIQMCEKGIEFQQVENAFVQISDIPRAQKLVNKIPVKILHHVLSESARVYCPVFQRFSQDYHWSIMQLEYATDIIFKSKQILAPIYEELFCTTIHAVKPDHVASFLGRKLHGNYQDELGNRLSTRIEGKCIKHYMGNSGIKMYDKFGVVLRLETTTNDVTFFKHYRRVEHRNGSSEFKYAPVRKSIYSLPDLLSIMAACNNRYLEFLSAIDDPTNPRHDLSKLSQRVEDNHHSYRGLNLFAPDDSNLLRILCRGEFFIRGFSNSDLRLHLGKKVGQISHILKRLRTHGIIKKATRCYKYYLTSLGKRVIAAALKLKETVIIPTLRAAFAH